jgi:acetyl-CoA carboxylase biotin carboxyl carrier protein
MNLKKKIRELVDILESEGLDEIEVRSFWRSVRIARGGSGRTSRRAGGEGGDAAAAGDVETALVAGGAVEEAAKPAANDGLVEIVSPMVGTFYRSSKPGEDPFIAEGTQVEVGQVLCIIEAMKLMNEIEAEKDGVIKKILVEDSQPVEFGQPLFLLESA